jgi:predicted GIY-YIG superfamily endonuclease
LKTWRRERKVALIEAGNPSWADLAEAWFAPYPSKKQIPHP